MADQGRGPESVGEGGSGRGSEKPGQNPELSLVSSRPRAVLAGRVQQRFQQWPSCS